jgi:hypothetical protein
LSSEYPLNIKGLRQTRGGSYKVVINYPRRELTLIPPASLPEEQALCRGIELPLIQEKDWGLAARIDTDIGELEQSLELVVRDD